MGRRGNMRRRKTRMRPGAGHTTGEGRPTVKSTGRRPGGTRGAGVRRDGNARWPPQGARRAREAPTKSRPMRREPNREPCDHGMTSGEGRAWTRPGKDRGPRNTHPDNSGRPGWRSSIHEQQVRHRHQPLHKTGEAKTTTRTSRQEGRGSLPPCDVGSWPWWWVQRTGVRNTRRRG